MFGNSKLLKLLFLFIVTTFLTIGVGGNVLGMQINKFAFSTFTVLNPKLESENINKGKQNTAESFLLLALKWSALFDDGLGISAIPSPDDDGVVVELIGSPLFFPNPFKLSRGAELGYRLSRNADVELRIFDMRANQILKTSFVSGTTGGIAGYNRLKMNLSTLNGYDLSSGVYFFILSSGGRVIGKGKFIVVP